MEEDYNNFLNFFYNKSIHKILDSDVKTIPSTNK